MRLPTGYEQNIKIIRFHQFLTQMNCYIIFYFISNIIFITWKAMQAMMWASQLHVYHQYGALVGLKGPLVRVISFYNMFHYTSSFSSSLISSIQNQHYQLHMSNSSCNSSEIVAGEMVPSSPGMWCPHIFTIKLSMCSLLVTSAPQCLLKSRWASIEDPGNMAPIKQALFATCSWNKAL